MLSSLRAAWAHADRGFVKELVSTALPISAQLVMSSSLGFIDVVMVGSLGETSVAAAGLFAKVLFIVVMMISALGSGAAVLVSHYLGARDLRGVQQVLAIALLAGVVLTLPVASICVIGPEWLMQWLTTDSVLAEAGASYLRITAPVHVTMAIVGIYAAVLRAQGHSSVPMVLGFVAVLLNTGLNYVLIFGTSLTPAWGLEGAAWATTVAKAVETALLLAWLAASASPLRVRRLARMLRGSGALGRPWRAYLEQARPLLVNELLWASGIFCFTLIYSRLGTQELAAVTLVGPIESISLEIFIGFSSACAILVGRRLGANEFGLAQHQALLLLVGIPGVALLFGGLMVLAQPLVWSLYAGVEPSVLARAQPLYLVIAATLWLRMYNVVACVGVLRAGGDTPFTLKADFVVVWLIVLPVAGYAGLAAEQSLVAVFGIAVGLEALLLAPLYTWRMRQGHWLCNLAQASSKAPRVDPV